jgi:uncharacterized RDD family membrane protein YckC
VSDYDPRVPGGEQPWGAPQTPGQEPTGGWGYPPGGGPPPGGQPYGGQQLPPYSQFGPSQSNWSETPPGVGASSTWGPRALGWLVDFVLVTIPTVILYIIGVSANSGALLVLTYVVDLVLWLWFGYQVGQSGASPGMRTVGLRCVKQSTGEVCGAGVGCVRALLNIIAGFLCGIGALVNYLWPVWDGQHQTLADKIVGTVVLRVPPQGFSIVPKPTS